MLSRLFICFLAAELVVYTLACMATQTAQLPGEPGDPGIPGLPGIRGKRDAEEDSHNLLYIMTQETSFQKAKELVEAQRDKLLKKLKTSENIYESAEKDLTKPLTFDDEGGYLTSVISLNSFHNDDPKECYNFAEKIMVLNNKGDSLKNGIKMVANCNGEQFY